MTREYDGPDVLAASGSFPADIRMATLKRVDWIVSANSRLDCGAFDLRIAN